MFDIKYNFVTALNKQINECYEWSIESSFGYVKLFDSDLFKYEIQEMPSENGNRMYRLFGNQKLGNVTMQELIDFLFKDAFNRYEVYSKFYDVQSCQTDVKKQIPTIKKTAAKPIAKPKTIESTYDQIYNAVCLIIVDKLGKSATLNTTVLQNPCYRTQLLVYLLIYRKMKLSQIANMLCIQVQSVRRIVKRFKTLSSKKPENIVYVTKLLFGVKQIRVNLFDLTVSEVMQKFSMMKK